MEVAISKIEREVLLALNKCRDKKGTIEEIKKYCNLKEDQIRGGLERLKAKGFLDREEIKRKIVNIKDKFREYVVEGLPETRLLKQLIENKKLSIEDAHLKKEEIGPAIGALKSKGIVAVAKKDGKIELLLINEKVKEKGKEKLVEQELLEQLPLEEKEIEKIEEDLQSKEIKKAYESLRKRGIIEVEERKHYIYKINEKGEELIKSKAIEEELLEALTPDVFRQKLWRKKKFRPYDPRTPSKAVSFGRKHITTKYIEKIRRIWISLGFEEMKGSIVLPEFWNFDVLYVPQDHPAREMQDTFFTGIIAEEGKIDKKLFGEVSRIHKEGWGQGLDLMKSLHLVPRTHTTSISALTLWKLGKNKEEMKKIKNGAIRKFFTIGKVFRNEVLDWKHLFELHQIEGIVVGKNLSMSHLITYLKAFYKKLGYKEIKLVPSFFPFTEPSAEIYVYVEEKDQWLEMGGCGILRPEVSEPLIGKDINVLAWGLGLERLIMVKEGIKDIREIYESTIKHNMERVEKWQ